MLSAKETGVSAGLSAKRSDRLRAAVARLTALDLEGGAEAEEVSDGVPIASRARADTGVVLIDVLSGEEDGERVFNWLESYLETDSGLKAEVIKANAQSPFRATEIIDGRLKERGIEAEVRDVAIAFLREEGGRWTEFIKKIQQSTVE